MYLFLFLVFLELHARFYCFQVTASRFPEQLGSIYQLRDELNLLLDSYIQYNSFRKHGM